MSENPYQSTETPATLATPRKPWFTPAGVILGLVAIGLTVALLLPASRGVPEAKWRSRCSNNARQILLALLQYEKDHGSLPPAYTIDDQGNRLHSWRTLILPYLDQQKLYEQIDLSKPWDDSVNAKACGTRVDVYLCPSVNVDNETFTTYLAVVGSQCAFSGPQGRQLRDFQGRAQGTVAVVDVSFEQAVHWMSPYDISIDQIRHYGPETKLHHGRKLVCGSVDGSVRTIDLEKDLHELLALLPPGPPIK